MKTKPKLSYVADDFISQYLYALGIEDVKHYLSPIKKNIEPFNHYPNIKEGVSLFENAIELCKHIGIVVDSDMDGYCSAAIMRLFLQYLGVGDDRITIVHHEGKQHGIKDVVDKILKSKIEFLIVPDAGSNDIEECRVLQKHDITILILDHHIITSPNPFACVINNQHTQVVNKYLSGSGVTDKFIQAFCKEVKIDYPNYSDIVAISLVTDVCDLSSMENRWYMYHGLHNVSNPFLQYLFDKCCKKRGYTPEAIGWDIGPLGNALARSEDTETKSIFFEGLIGAISPEDALRQMRKVKRLQDEKVKSVIEEIEPNLDTSTKVIVGFTDTENANYTGLIANKFNGKYNKPTILLRDTGYGSWSGSLRSPVPLATKINNGGLASAMGHEEACGVLIKKKNFEEFITWLNTLNLSDKPEIEITAKLKPQHITLELCRTIEKWEELWGHGIEAPTFVIETEITQDNVMVFEKASTTLKLSLDNLNCIKFFAKPEDIEAFKKYNKFKVELLVGELSVNEWEGNYTPQCIIQDYEITEIKVEQENWEDLF